MAEPRLAARALIRHPSERAVLLGQRSEHDSSSPGKWALLGGKIDPYETPRQTVIREILEEGGVAFAPEYTYHVHVNEEWKTHLIVGTIIGELSLDPEEHQDARYVSEAELDQYELAFDHEEFIRGFLRSLR